MNSLQLRKHRANQLTDEPTSLEDTGETDVLHAPKESGTAGAQPLAQIRLLQAQALENTNLAKLGLEYEVRLLASR